MRADEEKFKRRNSMQDLIKRKTDVDIDDMAENPKLNFDIERSRNIKWMLLTDGNLDLMEKHLRKKKPIKPKTKRKCRCKN